MTAYRVAGRRSRVTGANSVRKFMRYCPRDLRPATGRLRRVERFVDEHDRDIADDRVDAVAFHALQSLLDDRLLAAELLAVFVAHRRAPSVRQRDELHLFLAERAR